ncbi:MAG: helix-turn-helix transcriptional regulator [Ruminococcaceae bacterium]|nr:helix-turn-helix transcriptional regulator [Oscillospiraceae bacterium]
MTHPFFTERTNPYCISSADFLTVGTKWCHNSWDAKNNPTASHALYYRTDHDSTKAILHTLNGPTELLADRIYFFPAFSILRSEINGDMQKYYIHFQSDLLEFALYQHLQGSCSVPATSITKQLFDIILQNYTQKTPASEQKICAAMDLLLADLFALYSLQPRDIAKFKPVLLYMEQHYHEPITISELAGLMNVSTVYFSNCFKEAFHISPKQYLLSKRLYESQKLLRKTDLSVREIAEQVGFFNENYFSEFFSQKVGISALNFRKLYE